MNEKEREMLMHIDALELYMFDNCLTYGDRDNVRELVDGLKRSLVTIVGNRVIKGSKKNAT